MNYKRANSSQFNVNNMSSYTPWSYLQEDELNIQLYRFKYAYTEYINKLIRFDKDKIFRSPVDTKLVPDYATIIKQPMDFETMIRKNDEICYQDDIKIFDDDVMLIINNCKTYNASDTIFYKAAVKLEEYYNKIRPILLKKIGDISNIIRRRWYGINNKMIRAQKSTIKSIEVPIVETKPVDVKSEVPIIEKPIEKPAPIKQQLKSTEVTKSDKKVDTTTSNNVTGSITTSSSSLSTELKDACTSGKTSSNTLNNTPNTSSNDTPIPSNTSNTSSNTPVDPQNPTPATTPGTTVVKKRRRRVDYFKSKLFGNRYYDKANPIVHAIQIALTIVGLTNDSFGKLLTSPNGLSKLLNALDVVNRHLSMTQHSKSLWFAQSLVPLKRLIANFEWKRTYDLPIMSGRNSTFRKIQILMSRLKKIHIKIV